jgi:hypothetical protein
MLREFKEFLLRGNVVDLAVAVVIGAAFGTLISSFVENLLTPLITIPGEANFGGLKARRRCLQIWSVPQRGAGIHPDSSRGVLLRRQAHQRTYGNEKDRAGRRQPHQAMSGMSEQHPLRGAPVRVLHVNAGAEGPEPVR